MSTRVTILRGDITTEDVDAIVNAANQTLLGGAGVDGAIHDAAGEQLLEACRALPEVAPHVRCPTGEARITPGFALPARFVIHTVGPRYAQPQREILLASAFRSSLVLAEQRSLRTVALPAISCGIYGYPIAEAARIALGVAIEKAWALDEIRFVLFTESDRAAFARVAGELGIH